MAENKSGQRFSLSERHAGPLSVVAEVCIVAFERHLRDVEWAKQAGLAPWNWSKTVLLDTRFFLA
jgi:hypothetical protein